MSTVYYLNLPKLPTKMYNDLVMLCQKIPLHESNRQWLHNFHRGELTIAGNEYGTQDTAIDLETVENLKKYFKSYFPNRELKFILGRISNVVAGGKSTLPPHCDRKRQIAINYLLTTGGSNVRTCFYRENRLSSNFDTAENLYYKDVTLDTKIKFPAQTWHVYSVQQYHSVENIESDRYIFSIILDYNPSFDDFCIDYKNLLMPVNAI